MNKEQNNEIKIAIQDARAKLNLLKEDVRLAERAGIAGAVKIGKTAIVDAEAKIQKLETVYGK